MARTLVVKKHIDPEETKSLNDMFRQMTGLAEADVEILHPKFLKIVGHLIMLQRVIDQLGSFKAIRDDHPSLIPRMDEILAFSSSMKDYALTFGNLSTEDTPENKHNLNVLFKSLSNSETMNVLFATGTKLRPYKNSFEKMESLSGEFISLDSSMNMRLFAFTSLNIHDLWRTATDAKKKYVLTILHHIWKNIYALYRLITSPNIDIDKFSHIVVRSIKKLKDHIPRCDLAFKRIEEAVGTLKENFDTYYRDSVKAANPNLIIESFVLDVSTSGTSKNSPQLLGQFQQIIRFLRSKQNNAGKNPKVNDLFAVLSKNMDRLGGSDSKTTPSLDEKSAESDGVPSEIEDVDEPDAGQDEPDAGQDEPNAGQDEIPLAIPLEKDESDDEQDGSSEDESSEDESSDKSAQDTPFDYTHYLTTVLPKDATPQ